VLGYFTTGKVGFPMTLSIYFCSQSTSFNSQLSPRKWRHLFLFFRNFSRRMRNRFIPVCPQPYLLASRRTIVCIVTTDLTHRSSNPGRRSFPSLQTGRGPHPAPTSMGTKVLSPGVKRPERDVEHWHFHLVQKLKLSGAIALFLCIYSWHGQEQL
jgi:hypothetical protein